MLESLGVHPRIFMLSNYVLDKFVAPEISRLTQNGARDITHLPETATSWVRTFVLASMLKFSFEEQRRQYIFNFLRRAEGAVAYYHEARGYLADYLASGAEAISRYMLAALHFESAIANLYESAMLLRNLLGEEKLFVKGDRSFLDPD
jgi:hypothetical protein